MRKHLRDKRPILELGFLAVVSCFWLVVKTGRKPSRIVYPCQRAAVANIHVFLVALLPSLEGFRRVGAESLHFLDNRTVKSAVLLGCLLLALSVPFTSHPLPSMRGQFADASEPVQLDLMLQNALEAVNPSDLFFVQNVSGTNGNCDAAFSTLISLMERHGLHFFKTSTHPDGLIANRDVVLIKVNAVGPERSGTNTDLITSLITAIVNHPEGFSGEVIVADNGQDTGGIDLAEHNAFDYSQSFQDVANGFGSFKVSAFSWYPMGSNMVNEYSQGDFNDGYIVNWMENPVTHLRASYPKFTTKYGTHVSFRYGIWNTTTNSYESEQLKVINFPVLKSHYNYGVTASVKNYMGVVSQTLTNTHDQIRYGALGTAIAESRFPTLTLLDAIWVNANPIEGGLEGGVGPPTPYEVASYTNVLGASQDLVALEYYAAKHILIPAATAKGYTAYSSLDPDYAPVTPGLTESYHNYLEQSMNELQKAGYHVTMNENQMNVRLATATAGNASSIWDVALTASAGGYSDVSVFGVRSDATEDFDLAYDQKDPPAPSAGVVSYFWNPSVSSTPDLEKMSNSMIHPSGEMIWSYVVKLVAIDGAMNIGWTSTQIAAIPSEYSVLLLTQGDVIDMRFLTSYSLAAEADTTYTFTVVATTLDLTKPVANAGQDQTVNEDNIVSLDGSASWDDVSVIAYTWTFSDVSLQTLIGQKPTYIFNTPGIYPITLNVTDADGNCDTDTTVITVLDVTNPVANAGQNHTVMAGASVSFDASASVDNGGIANYNWDFGDGTTGTGEATTHTYANPGAYTVTLTVEDAAGNTATHQIAVTVQSAEEPNSMLLIGAGVAVIGIAVAAVLLLRKRM